MEVILSQSGFKSCTEPLNLFNDDVRRYLGIESWEELYSLGSEAALLDYFEAFHQGRLSFKNHNPLRGQYRFFTDRIVFKILHGAEDRIEQLSSRLNGRIVLLLRHPIAVSLSRTRLPRLDAFLNTDYSEHFSEEQLKHARRIANSGSPLERGVLSWCLQNSVCLRDRKPDWAVITYEQMVLEPIPVLDELAAKLELTDSSQMFSRLPTASGTTDQSDDSTRKTLAQPVSAERQRILVERWREKVSRQEEASLMSILEIFSIDAYQADNPLPAASLWLQSKTATPDESLVNQ